MSIVFNSDSEEELSWESDLEDDIECDAEQEEDERKHEALEKEECRSIATEEGKQSTGKVRQQKHPNVHCSDDDDSCDDGNADGSKQLKLNSVKHISGQNSTPTDNENVGSTNAGNIPTDSGSVSRNADNLSLHVQDLTNTNDTENLKATSENLETASEALTTSTENSVADGKTSSWTLVNDAANDFKPDPLPVFPHPCSLRHMNADKIKTPYDAFKLMFDDTVMLKLLEWTNERAETFFAREEEEGRRGRKFIVKSEKDEEWDDSSDSDEDLEEEWKEVTMDELYTFLALVFLVKFRENNIHDELFNGPTTSVISSLLSDDVMPRMRHQAIMKFLRFGSVADAKKKVRRGRLEEYVELLRQNWRRYVLPGENVAIGDSWVCWRSGEECIVGHGIGPNMTHHGVKIIYVSPCEEKWKGYMWNLYIHYGPSDCGVIPRTPTLSSLFGNVLAILLDGLLDSGRHVAADDFFTSVQVAEYLLTRKTALTGKVKRGRGPPEDIRKELVEGKHTYARKGNILVGKWKARRDMNVLTTRDTAHWASDDTVLPSTSEAKPKRKETKPVLPPIAEYKKMMVTTETVDDRETLLELELFKGEAWFRQVGLFLLFCSLENANIIYNNITGKKPNFNKFIRELGLDMLAKHNPVAASLIELRNASLDPTLPGHSLVKIPTSWNTKICVICEPKKETRFTCSGCSLNGPGFCGPDHFKEWHKSYERNEDLERSSDGMDFDFSSSDDFGNESSFDFEDEELSEKEDTD